MTHDIYGVHGQASNLVFREDHSRFLLVLPNTPDLVRKDRVFMVLTVKGIHCIAMISTSQFGNVLLWFFLTKPLFVLHYIKTRQVLI